MSKKTDNELMKEWVFYSKMTEDKDLENISSVAVLNKDFDKKIEEYAVDNINTPVIKKIIEVLSTQ